MSPWKFESMILSRFWGNGPINPLACYGRFSDQWKIYIQGRCNQLFSWKESQVPIAVPGSLKWGQRLAWQFAEEVAKFLKKREAIPRHLASYKEEFQKQSLLSWQWLENHIDTAVGFHIEGNDKPWSVDGDTETSELLLLDEHTAALDQNQSGPHDLDGSVCETDASRLLWSLTIWKMLWNTKSQLDLSWKTDTSSKI